MPPKNYRNIQSRIRKRPLVCLRSFDYGRVTRKQRVVGDLCACTPPRLPSHVSRKSLGFVKGILETGGVMDKCVQIRTRNYGALGQTARVCFGVLCANKKKKEVKRDFGDLRIRRSEGRVVNTPLVFKRVLFEERRGKKKRKEKRGEEKGQESPGRENGRKEEERRKRERGDGKRLTESRGERE
ncbi:hypothetical protein TNCV_1368441 [Trichonephila clavipes]|nr:hypothetical protein TNCV_1368441 [Trichonephila clavipes]